MAEVPTHHTLIPIIVGWLARRLATYAVGALAYVGVAVAEEAVYKVIAGVLGLAAAIGAEWLMKRHTNKKMVEVAEDVVEIVGPVGEKKPTQEQWHGGLP